MLPVSDLLAAGWWSSLLDLTQRSVAGLSWLPSGQVLAGLVDGFTAFAVLGFNGFWRDDRVASKLRVGVVLTLTAGALVVSGGTKALAGQISGSGAVDLFSVAGLAGVSG